MTLMVSVSGIRGLIADTLTPSAALEFALAYGVVLDGGRVVLARDSRPSGPIFEAAALAGLLASGCEVTQLGIAMTPTVGHAIRTGGYAGGIIVTASHNPGEYNGLKFLDHLGVAPDPDRARRIVALRDQHEFRLVQTGFTTPAVDYGAGERHVAAVLAAVEVDLAPLRGRRVVLDSINGAGCVDGARLLNAVGCDLVHMNSEPNGQFAHRPEPIAENLTDLCTRVQQSGAALGFAQDPDADRLAMVDEHGVYIGEEYTLALAVDAVLAHRLGPVAANLSTSRMIDDLAARYGVPVLRTPVGEAHVARAMRAGGAVIGGEGNGGVIDPRICWVRDSLSAMTLVLQRLAETGQSLSQLVAGLPRYACVKQKCEAPRDRIDRAVTQVIQAFAELHPNTSDGVRIDFPEGWVHLRASNTEPIVRVISEARTDSVASALLKRVRAVAGI